MAVVNVFAASKNAGSVWKKAAVMLEQAKVHYRSRFTGGEHNAKALSYIGCESGYRKFIAVGGDGTVHDVLNGIASYVDSHRTEGVSFDDFTLAVIPVGSGNDWVKSIGAVNDIADAVHNIAEGYTGRQDVVKVSVLDRNGADYSSKDVLSVSYMANIAGVGLDARVCEIVNREKEQGRRGRLLYVKALLYCIRHRVPVRAKVICDGKEVFDGKYLSIAFGTGKYSGGGMRQTPLAVLDDGLIDVTIIPDISMLTIATKAPKLFTGNFHKVKELIQARCAKVTILPATEADGEPVEVDGEVVGHAPVMMEVLDGQINIIVPDRRC